ncbi:hypothetical protein C0J52_15501 [Blattella germanica]|nr:hypothetical protein C0J52_15501 [Blattella germanica]
MSYSNDNGVRLVTFATSKNLITSPDGKTRNQIDHVLVDKRWHSSIIDIRSVRGLDCNSDHQLVRVKVRERLALTRGTDTKDDSDKYELKNLRNDEEFETLECSEENVATEEETNINREWETIRDTIKLSASESVGHLKKRQSRKWFDEECVDMVHKRKLAKMNWMREPNEQNSEQLCSIRRETTRFLKNKQREYSKRWGNYFNQLLNVHGEEEIEENNVQTAEVLVEEPSALEVEMTIEKLKMYKASGIDGIPVELIKSGGEKLREKIHRLFSLIWKQEALPNEWKESVIIPIYKKGDKTDCNNYRGISLLSTSYKILTNTPYIDKIIGDHQCAFRRNREKLYSILMNFGVPKRIVRLIGMCLNGTKNALSPLLFSFVLEHAIKSLEDKESVQLNGIHKLLVNTDDIVLLGDSKEKLGLEVNVNKTKYMVTHRNASCNGNGQLMTNEGNFEKVAEFKYPGALITNRNVVQKEIKHRLNSGNACYYALQRLLSSQLLSKTLN